MITINNMKLLDLASEATTKYWNSSGKTTDRSSDGFFDGFIAGYEAVPKEQINHALLDAALYALGFTKHEDCEKRTPSGHTFCVACVLKNAIEKVCEK